MIQVTLTFSSLHAAIKALSEIPETALAGAPAVQEVAAAPVEKLKDRTVKAGAPTPVAPTNPPISPTAVVAEVAAPVSTASASNPPAAPVAAAPQVSTAAPDRSVVSRAAVALALKDKPRVIEILAGFGAKAAKELTEDQLAPALAALTAALEVKA